MRRVSSSGSAGHTPNFESPATQPFQVCVITRESFRGSTPKGCWHGRIIICSFVGFWQTSRCCYKKQPHN